MNRANLPWHSVQAAAVRWDETGVPLSDIFEDVYYSRDNGLEESHHVFLQGNDLPRRWRQHADGHFCIGETGFGTGLNFLLTWQAWCDLPEPRPDLHYLSIEKYPLSRQDLARAVAAWPTLEYLAEQLLKAYPGLLPGQHRLLLQEGRVRLDLWWEDAAEALPDLAGREQHLVDAWYLDGFAPARNESMWSASIMNAIAALSRPQATFATFTVAGAVRRGLTAAGFRVTRATGYGRKRECLRGEIQQRQTLSPVTDLIPWDRPTTAEARPKSAVVLGGGLAGCTVAAALARRGLSVTLLERDTIAGAGSGNEQGILYTRLSRQHSSLLDFGLQSYLFASSFYRNMFSAGTLRVQLDGELCGNFQQSSNTGEMAALDAPLRGLKELACILDSAAANSVLGIEQHSSGYWYPGSGWLRPGSVCQALLEHHNIQVLENCGEVTLCNEEGLWRALADGNTLASAPCVVAAPGTATVTMEQFDWLPLQKVRGQTTQLPATHTFSNLRAALCHEGYIAPARLESHCIGATFDVHEEDPATRASDHRDNLARLASAVPAWREALEALDPESLEGRVGYRCASPDYLPVVGAAPDVTAFLRDFGPLRKNARQLITSNGSYLPGLFLTTAHGSRGLTSTPPAAELLASTICGEPPPFSRELCRALAPARFIIRNLSRNRI